MIVNVFSYPKGNQRHIKALEYIKELVALLESRYQIYLPMEVTDGKKNHPEFYEFIIGFLTWCNEAQKGIDVYWLYCISCCIDNVNSDITPLMKEMPPNSKQFLLDAQKKSQSWKAAIKGLFFNIEGLTLNNNEGKWGASMKTFKDTTCISIEISGLKESIFHEFLHLVGVSEGYHLVTLDPLPGCENCWMQWDSTKGEGLCEKHREEIKDFIT